MAATRTIILRSRTTGYRVILDTNSIRSMIFISIFIAHAVFPMSNGWRPMCNEGQREEKQRSPVIVRKPLNRILQRMNRTWICLPKPMPPSLPRSAFTIVPFYEFPNYLPSFASKASRTNRYNVNGASTITIQWPVTSCSSRLPILSLNNAHSDFSPFLQIVPKVRVKRRHFPRLWVITERRGWFLHSLSRQRKPRSRIKRAYARLAFYESRNRNFRRRSPIKLIDFDDRRGATMPYELSEFNRNNGTNFDDSTLW